jgi:hypothetical protein
VNFPEPLAADPREAFLQMNESKQLIPHEKTASDFGKKRLCHLGSGGKRNNILMYTVIYIIFYLSSYFN